MQKTVILEKQILRNGEGVGTANIAGDIFRFPNERIYLTAILITGSKSSSHPQNTSGYDIYINKQLIGDLKQHYSTKNPHMKSPSFFKGNIVFMGKRDYQLTLKRHADTPGQSAANYNWNAAIYYLEEGFLKHREIENLLVIE